MTPVVNHRDCLLMQLLSKCQLVLSMREGDGGRYTSKYYDKRCSKRQCNPFER